MKYLHTLFLFTFSLLSAFADDDYTNNLYTSATLSYWCAYKELPSSKEEIAKVTKIKDHDANITIDFEDWLKTLSYEINGDVLTIIRKSRSMAKQNSQVTVTTKSSSNCGLAEILKKKEEELDF